MARIRKTQPGRSFLDLPREIRDMIYDHCRPSGKLSLWSPEVDHSSPSSPSSPDFNFNCHQSELRTGSSIMLLQQTCHQLHFEASYTLYTNIDLKVTVRDMAPMQRASKLASRYAPFIREISIGRRWELNFVTARFHVWVNAFYTSLPIRFTGLRRLVMELPGPDVRTLEGICSPIQR